MVRLVATVGAMGGLVATVLPGGAVRPGRPDLEVVLGAAGLMVVAGLTFVRRGLVAAGGLALLAVGWAGYLLYRDLASGLPGGSTAVLAVSAVVVLAGVGANVVRPGVVGVPFAAALVVVLVGAGVAGALVAPRLPVRASGAEAVEPPALGEQPGARRWTWSSSGPVLDVVAAGAGVVVAVEGGELAALDGTTGSVRWRYARPGAHVRALAATPDRATVLAAFAPGGGKVTGSGLLVVLDALTGDAVRESTVDERLTDPSFLVPTDTVLPDRDGGTVRAVDLRGGEELWTWRAPDGCESPFFLPRNGHDVVLTSLRCDDEVGIVALDERTGERRWDHMSTSDGWTDFHLDTPPSGRVVSARFAGVDVLLDAATGDELYTVDEDRSVILAGPYGMLSDVPDDATGPEVLDPATGEVRELPIAECRDARAVVTTASAYLRLCGEDSLVWQDFETGRVSRAPVGWGPGPVSASLLLNRRAHAVVLSAPGAIVVARADDTVVIGYPA